MSITTGFNPSFTGNKKENKFMNKLIYPAVLATGLTACTVNVPQNQKDSFDRGNTCECIIKAAKADFQNDTTSNKFKLTIFQALPYINGGKFKQVEVMKNGLVIDGKYKLKRIDEDTFEGKYDLFNNHSFKLKKLDNGNYNLFYQKDDEVEVVGFSKNGKMLSLFEAFKQNSSKEPIKLELNEKLNRKISNVLDVRKEEYTNKTDNIVKFNNPLSRKEFNLIKNNLKRSFEDNDYEVFDISYKRGIIKAFVSPDRGKHHENHTYEYSNPIGLIFKDLRGLYGLRTAVKDINFQPLENGGYHMIMENGMGYRDRNYFDSDLNLKDKKWYEKEKALIEKFKAELKEANLEEVLKEIKAGKPAKLSFKDFSVILIPKLDEKVVGDTDFKTRFKTTREELPPEFYAAVYTVVIIGGAIVGSYIIPVGYPV